MTRLLTRRDLDALLEPAACLAALRDGFLAMGTAMAVPGQRLRTDPPFPGTATAVLPGIEAYTVKVDAKSPDAQPVSRGVICLRSAANGELLALLDSATVTAWRTGLAAALGTHVLADPAEDAVVGVIGTGAQTELMLRGLDVLRPYGQLLVHDTDFDRATEFAVQRGGKVLGSATEIASAADIVLLATWSRTPPLTLADTREGQHLTSLGADEPGKRELAADLLDAALVVVDDRQLVAAVGALASPDIDTTLGDVLRGTHPGRADATIRSVYAPVGLPWQDLALAWPAYERAERDGVGRRVNLPG
ncbi:ornithine cyclodeaminase family protein [Streptomyces sp. NBC_01622]|uniref:ornithine cyclodeaminase family protein n=1 Tax=Streptomyces sp. NBC_01622 TaxID=2975903 RepID=UPI0038638693|nr:ornithine cyclodeaminase family protein [Streptomyces sp. NBC_01622]